jgi:DNA polymerase III gamma/tau subunit
VLGRDLAGALNLVAGVRDDGADLRHFTADLVAYFRSLLLVCAGAGASLALGEEAAAELVEAAEGVSVGELLRLTKSLAGVDFRADPQSPLPLELAIVEAIEAPRQVAAVPAEQPGVPPTNGSRAGAAGTSSVADRMRSALAPRTAPPRPIRQAPSQLPPERPEAAPEPNPRPSETADLQAPEASAPPAEPPAEPAEVSTADVGTPSEGAAAPGLVAAQRRFRELYERCRQINRNAAGVLNSAGCDIVEIGQTEIVLGFKHQPIVDRASTPPFEPALRQAVAEVFGPQFGLRCRLEPDVPNRLQLLDAERPSHLLDEAIKLGARPLNPAQPGPAEPV